RLQRLTRARGVEQLELEVVLLEDAGLGAEMRDRGVPVAALPDSQLELVLGRGGGGGSEQRQHGEYNGDLANAGDFGLLVACFKKMECSPCRSSPRKRGPRYILSQGRVFRRSGFPSLSSRRRACAGMNERVWPIFQVRLLLLRAP